MVVKALHVASDELERWGGLTEPVTIRDAPQPGGADAGHRSRGMGLADRVGTLRHGPPPLPADVEPAPAAPAGCGSGAASTSSPTPCSINAREARRPGAAAWESPCGSTRAWPATPRSRPIAGRDSRSWHAGTSAIRIGIPCGRIARSTSSRTTWCTALAITPSPSSSAATARPSVRELMARMSEGLALRRGLRRQRWACPGSASNRSSAATSSCAASSACGSCPANRSRSPWHPGPTASRFDGTYRFPAGPPARRSGKCNRGD